MRLVVQLRHALVYVAIGLVPLSGSSWLMAHQKHPPADQMGAVFEVRWAGALKNVMMKGDLIGTIDLKALSKLPHVNAVGALVGLVGEVTILDSAVSIARVQDGKVVTSQVAEGKACVLVY